MTRPRLALQDRKYLKQLMGALDGDSGAIVVLMGSWARGTAGDHSDLDLLVVDGALPDTPPPPLIQVTMMTSSELHARVHSGDDFAQWAIRFGTALKERSRWERMVAKIRRQMRWPDPALKRQQAGTRLERAEELLSMGDPDAAHEELRHAYSHLARAKLLDRRVFPLSRSELPGQLDETGEGFLARKLRLLLNDDPTWTELMEHAGFLRAALTRRRARHIALGLFGAWLILWALLVLRGSFRENLGAWGAAYAVAVVAYAAWSVIPMARGRESWVSPTQHGWYRRITIRLRRTWERVTRSGAR